MPEGKALVIVARHEFTRMLKRKSFLMLTLGLPLLYLFIFGAIAFFTTRSGQGVLGYVDQAHIFPENPRMPAQYEDYPSPRAFPDVESGKQALAAGEIIALYVLPEDYWQGGAVVLYKGDKHVTTSDFFSDFIRVNLVREVQNEQVRARLLDGPHYISRALGTTHAVGGIHTVRLAITIGTSVLFYLVMMLSGSYLLQVVADEKENRMLEMLVTSTSSRVLILGKTIGLVMISAIQFLVWGMLLLTGAIYVITRPGFPVPITLNFALIPWGELGILMLYFLPTFLLSASLMIALGSVVNDQRQGQQYSSIFSTFFFIPLYFLVQIIAEPNNALSLGLTFFPFTTFLTLMIRRAIAVVPSWQMYVAWGLLVATTGAAMLFAPRVFRWGMLRYGQGVSLKGLRFGWRKRKGGSHV